MRTSHVRECVEAVQYVAKSAGRELDEDTVLLVVFTLDQLHLLQDPWARGFGGGGQAWVQRVQQVSREALERVLEALPPPEP